MRSLVALTLALAVSSVAAAGTQTPPPSQPTPQQQPAPQQQAQAPPGRVFASDSGSGLMFNMIKADKTADFEMVMGRLKEALQKSEDPVRKQQAASWKVFRAHEPGPNGAVLYVFVMDPAVKGGDYSVSKILAEAFPLEVQALYEKFSQSYLGGQQMVSLSLLSNFGVP